jgi:hypothetical protein
MDAPAPPPGVLNVPGVYNASEHSSTVRSDAHPHGSSASAKPKARTFLSSIDSAKSAPSRPSFQLTRKPARAEDRVRDGDNHAASIAPIFNCVKCEGDDDLRVGGEVEQLHEHKADTLDEGVRAEAVEAGIGCCAASSLSSAGAELVAASLQPNTANISTSFRSKTAVSLHSYISASCDQSSVGATSNRNDLAYSSHLRLATNGMSLFDSAPDAEVRACAICQ